MIQSIVRELIDDIEIFEQRIALRVWRELDKNPRIYFEPHAIKTWFMAEKCRTNKKRTKDAINLLISKGFVIDCGRQGDGVRLLMLARERGDNLQPARRPA